MVLGVPLCLGARLERVADPAIYPSAQRFVQYTLASRLLWLWVGECQLLGACGVALEIERHMTKLYASSERHTSKLLVR